MDKSRQEIVVHPDELPLTIKLVDPKNSKYKDYSMIGTKKGGLCLNAPNTPKNNPTQN